MEDRSTLNICQRRNQIVRHVSYFVRNERGTVESSLVLIPLLSLFLIATQISVAIHARNVTKMVAQDEASKRAITGTFLESDRFLHIYSPDRNQNIDLVITHKKSVVPKILEGEREVNVAGLAIIENQR